MHQLDKQIEFLANELEKSLAYSTERLQWRLAGALEMCLKIIGKLKSSETFEYRSGGKCFIPYILDLTWKENYPTMILRLTKEYLKNEKNSMGKTE